MIKTTDLIKAGFLEHPFLRYVDSRFFFPHISEQRKVMEVAYSFLLDERDPQKNLGVIAGPVGSGKTMLALKLAAMVHPQLSVGSTHGLYMNTNTITEPRHFLMTVIDSLGLPLSRSNADRLDSIYAYLSRPDRSLLLVLDGPPVDQEYLYGMLKWSVEHNKSIKALVFLQDLYDTTSNLGDLNTFLGLYHPFHAPSVQETANMLYSRCKMAGHPNPLSLLEEQMILEISTNAHSSLTTALNLAAAYLEGVIVEKNNRLAIMDI
jgi:Cdc6-like AAA superfamily ATPase